MKTILIMGLPGAGKTTFTNVLEGYLQSLGSTVDCLNADTVRRIYDDWDFTMEGRLRQAKRMYRLARTSDSDLVIIDMVCPTEETRSIVNPDFIIWVNTIKEGRFQDTNKIFEPPSNPDFIIQSFEYHNTARHIAHLLVGWNQVSSLCAGNTVLQG